MTQGLHLALVFSISLTSDMHDPISVQVSTSRKVPSMQRPCVFESNSIITFTVLRRTMIVTTSRVDPDQNPILPPAL
jgi:hypothetical protein